jgi:hypothetical protein
MKRQPLKGCYRGFSAADLAIARKMMERGATWNAIARAIGRRSPAGIRRRFDEAFRLSRNAKQADYMRNAYSGGKGQSMDEAAADNFGLTIDDLDEAGEPQVDSTLEDIREALLKTKVPA